MKRLLLTGTLVGVGWSLTACWVGFSPLHHWQAWAIFGACEASYLLGRAVPYA